MYWESGVGNGHWSMESYNQGAGQLTRQLYLSVVELENLQADASNWTRGWAGVEMFKTLDLHASSQQLDILFSGPCITWRWQLVEVLQTSLSQPMVSADVMNWDNTEWSENEWHEKARLTWTFWKRHLHWWHGGGGSLPSHNRNEQLQQVLGFCLKFQRQTMRW